MDCFSVKGLGIEGFRDVWGLGFRGLLRRRLMQETSVKATVTSFGFRPLTKRAQRPCKPKPETSYPSPL